MEDSETDIRKKLEEKEKEIRANSKERNEKLAKLKREKIEEVAKEIVNVCPKCNSNETFEKIVQILLAFQAKMEEPLQKFLEMDRQRQIIELQGTKIDDLDWWAKVIGNYKYQK